MVLKEGKAKTVLDQLEKDLKRELLRTWREQGHHMTGAVVEQAEFVAQETANKLSFLVYMFPYGGYMETGVAASSIPFSKPTGRGGTSKYIQALISYAQKKMNLPAEKAKGVAFAIATKHKQEGMPTSASRRFSSTGSRTGWITETMERNRSLIEARMFELLDEVFTVRFNNMIDENQKLFNQTAK